MRATVQSAAFKPQVADVTPRTVFFQSRPALQTCKEGPTKPQTRFANQGPHWQTPYGGTGDWKPLHCAPPEQGEFEELASHSSMPLALPQALLDMQVLVPVPLCGSPVRQQTSPPLQSSALPHESATPEQEDAGMHVKVSDGPPWSRPQQTFWVRSHGPFLPQSIVEGGGGLASTGGFASTGGGFASTTGGCASFTGSPESGGGAVASECAPASPAGGGCGVVGDGEASGTDDGPDEPPGPKSALSLAPPHAMRPGRNTAREASRRGKRRLRYGTDPE